MKRDFGCYVKLMKGNAKSIVARESITADNVKVEDLRSKYHKCLVVAILEIIEESRKC